MIYGCISNEILLKKYLNDNIEVLVIKRCLKKLWILKMHAMNVVNEIIACLSKYIWNVLRYNWFIEVFQMKYF